MKKATNKFILNVISFLCCFPFSNVLEGTARYAGFLLAPAEGSGRGQGFLCPSGQKKACNAVLAYFWCSVVTSVTLSSNLCNFEKKILK